MSISQSTADPKVRAMQKRASRAIAAIERGADPYLALYYVVWPPTEYVEEKRAA